MEKYDQIQAMFIGIYQEVVKSTKALTGRDFIFIPPSVSKTGTKFTGMYDVKTGLGFGLSLNAFTLRSFREAETGKIIMMLFDRTIQTIKECGVPNNPIEIGKFELGIENCRTKFIETRIVNKSKIYIFKLEHINASNLEV